MNEISINQLEEIEAHLRNGAFSTYDMECIYPELKRLRSNEIYLEIGVDKGKSLSFARYVTDPGVVVCGVDLREDPKVENTKFFRGDSSTIAAKWHWELFMWKISLLFIDGDHSYEGCKKDIQAWLPHMKQHGVIFFHDHDESSPGVLQAASEFVNTYGKTHELNYKIYKKTDKNTSMAGIWL